MRRRVGILVGVVLLLVLVFGCTQTAVTPVRYPDDLRYSASLDSLSLDLFLALSRTDRDRRAAESARWAEAAQDGRRVADRFRALHNAVGLEPTAAAAWVELADLARWFGDYLVVDHYLAGFQAALPYVPPADRAGLLGRAVLLRAWLQYDRGHWSQGLSWADSARNLEEDKTATIRGLLLAGSGQTLYAEDVAREISGQRDTDNDVLWVAGAAQWYGGNPALARAIFHGQTGMDAGGVRQTGPDGLVQGELRPEPGRAAECWRDWGQLEEVLGNGNEARDRYERSAAAVPGIDPTAVTKLVTAPLDGRRIRSDLPVWLAFDRYFVTGSISAYTALVFERFVAAGEAGSAVERELWGGAAINGAGICVRRGLDVPWALRTRGLVLVSAGRPREGRGDLERAKRDFDRLGVEDFETSATLGHLYLQEDRPQVAWPLLEQAVRLDPLAASAWSDLGLARVHTGDLAGARVALDRALALDPELAVAHYNRGLLNYNAQDWKAAIVDLEAAARLAPSNQEIGRILQQARHRLRRAGEK